LARILAKQVWQGFLPNKSCSLAKLCPILELKLIDPNSVDVVLVETEQVETEQETRVETEQETRVETEQERTANDLVSIVLLY
jgi:hypothetical protein